MTLKGLSLLISTLYPYCYSLISLLFLLLFPLRTFSPQHDFKRLSPIYIFSLSPINILILITIFFINILYSYITLLSSLPLLFITLIIPIPSITSYQYPFYPYSLEVTLLKRVLDLGSVHLKGPPKT
jgi:hypothetical protein